MLIYMVHPNHGTHIAYDASEVERCKANGWSVRDEKKPEPVVGELISRIEACAEADRVFDEQAPLKRKPGRPKKAS